MNISIRILSVFSALIITFQPVLPYIEYYTFKKYISENLCINRDKPKCCCHGKCFLKKMLKESNTSSGQKAPVREQQKVFTSSLPETKYNFEKFEELITLYSFYLESYQFNYSADLFHPPQTSISSGV